MKRLLGAALLSAAVALPGAVAAKSDFYDGKTITYIVATSPGGGYDTYARLIAKYLEKYLGAQVQVKNLPGAGHIIGTNTLYASKPDGLTIGTFNTGLIYAQLLDREGIDFDLRQMSWIGKAAADPRAVLVSDNAGIDTVEDLRNAKDVKFASSGIGSAAYTDTKLISQALDLPIEIIPGFNGNEGELAMMRGEVQGQVGSLSSLQPFVDNGNGHFIMAIGGGDDIPPASKFADTQEGKEIIAVIEALSSLGRLTAAPPETDPDRLAELRDAYKSALTDPDLLAEAEKMGRPIDPAFGEDVANSINAALNVTPETVEVIAKAVEVEVPTLTVTSKLTDMSEDHKHIKFMSGDEEISAKISGSRTKVMLDGAQAGRKDLFAGMECTIEYNPENEDNEPVKMDCHS